jgi:HK97 family phage prohead protease
MPTKDYPGRLKSYHVPFTLSADGGTITGIGNAPVIDRYDELLPVESYARDLDAFRANPIMLLQHRADWPIGSYSTIEARATGLHLTGHLGHGFEPADTARKQVAQKILRQFSVGFRELESGAVNKDGIYVFKRVEILECSIVSIPANAAATFEVAEGGKLLRIKMVDEQRRMARPLITTERVRLTGLRQQLASVLVQIARRELRRTDARHDRTLARLRTEVAALEKAIARRVM